MPRGRSNTGPAKSPEPEQVELDEAEMTEEEEVEYEEVEEEVEEVVEEEIEEEVEDDLDEDDTAEASAGGADAPANGYINMKDEGEDECQKFAELLALPPHGSEVYLGGIPPDATQDDLKSFCEAVGEVLEVKIMKGKGSSDSKGYAFVSFRTKELAKMAIGALNNKELKGNKIRCSESQSQAQAKNKLFIGNIPKNWSETDLKKAVEKVGPGVTAIQLMKDPQNQTRNRGYAFVEYYNQACAEYSRKKMSNPKFKLDGNAPTVSWAEPKPAADSSDPQVKAVYVKNLPKDVTEDQLQKLFERHGEITKVALPPAKAGHENRYGFVHFKERSSAMNAIKETERYEINGQVLGCSLAKPQSEKKADLGLNALKGPLLPTYPLGYGMMGGAYGALPSAFTQPMVYGRGTTPGMAMVPMILPDGRLGYVLQQPGVPMPAPPRSSERSAGSSSSSGRQNNSGSGGRRFRPY